MVATLLQKFRAFCRCFFGSQDPPPPLPDSDDILLEILVRLPPLASSLPRASAVCKRWRRLLSDPQFLCRFRAHHRTPPVLGFIAGSGMPSFYPALGAPNRIPAARFTPPQCPGECWRPLGCRHGLALFIDYTKAEVIVWDPVAGHQRRVAWPPKLQHVYTGAVLVDAGENGAGHAHGGDRLSSFKLVLVCSVKHASAWLYESKSGRWGIVSSTGVPSLFSPEPAVLIGSTFCWLLGWCGIFILEFDMDTQSMAVTQIPSYTRSIDAVDIQVVRTEDSGLGIAILAKQCIQIWGRRAISDGAFEWALQKTVWRDDFLALRSSVDNELQKWLARILGYDEDTNVILVSTDAGTFMVQLDTIKITEFFCDPLITKCYPFASFYTAVGDGDGSTNLEGCTTVQREVPIGGRRIRMCWMVEMRADATLTVIEANSELGSSGHVGYPMWNFTFASTGCYEVRSPEKWNFLCSDDDPAGCLACHLSPPAASSPLGDETAPTRLLLTKRTSSGFSLSTSAHYDDETGGSGRMVATLLQKFRAFCRCFVGSQDLPPPPPPALPDSDDILLEILVRLPPLPSSLPRASAVCKRWRRLVSDPQFLRHFRAHHRTPPLLGFIAGSGMPSFYPALGAPDRIPAARFTPPRWPWECWRTLGCRHGLALFIDSTRAEVIVWDPIANHQRRVPLPLRLQVCAMHGTYTGAVLVAAGENGAGHAHGGDRLSSFKLVLVCRNSKQYTVCLCLYESKSGKWGNVNSTEVPFPVSPEPAVLVGIGSAICWVLGACGTAILEFDTDTQSMAVTQIPSDTRSIGALDIQVVRTEDRGLGIAVLAKQCIQFWWRRAISDGSFEWTLQKTVWRSDLLSLKPSMDKLDKWLARILGYDEDTNVILVATDFGIFMIQLDTIQFTELPSDHLIAKLFERGLITRCHLYSSFYTAGNRRCPSASPR
ncbi:hypothetical protein EJB05_35136 [Eragrostis curvula]|uniref:F-box domain-containing protein n=1 Tax=Eragrostis curvula TaxID=38414 RepID=A0A5J9U5V2_9POAL|nr:hypothetical protein EJB05_35136 [Eragrostis curvula]